jgi:hypothetical protein
MQKLIFKIFSHTLQNPLSFLSDMPLSINQPSFTVAVLTSLRSSLKHKTYKNSLNVALQIKPTSLIIVSCSFALQNLVSSPLGSAERIDPLATLATRQPLALRVPPDFSSLTNKDSAIFGKKSKHSVICNFSRQRKFAAIKLSNPRLLKIHFHTFRHWKATMEYQRTKDILYVMRMLGHKSIQNTLVYTQMVQFKKEEYASAIASTIEDAQKLVESGFEYVTEIDGVKLFRKRK